MKKIILLFSALVLLSCKMTEIEQQVDAKYNSIGLSGKLFKELETIGNNLRDQQSNFRNKTAVDFAVREVYGDELVQKIEQLRLKQRKYRGNRSSNDLHSKNLKKVVNLIINSKKLEKLCVWIEKIIQ